MKCSYRKSKSCNYEMDTFSSSSMLYICRYLAIEYFVLNFVSYYSVNEIVYTESVMPSSNESTNPTPSSSSIFSNQLVLITNDFCTNFPLLKPIENDRFKERSLAEMGYDKNSVTHWEKIVQPKKEDIKILMNQIIMKHDKTDVDIIIDETIFRCHMIVLQCYSTYFDNITDNPKTITLPSNELTPRAFYMIYKWMLSSDPTIDRKNILEFFKAAQFLQMECAASQCWACICDQQFVEDLAMFLYLEARAIGLADVRTAMSSRICKFFLHLVASKEFLEFNVDEVVMFLDSNSIGVHTEIEVLFSALRWLFFDWKQRSSFSLKLIQCIRFGHMTQSQLVLLKRNKEAEISQVVDDTVTKLIDDEISLLIMKMNTGAFRNEPISVELVERQWLAAGKVEKLFDFAENASYKIFLDYLRYLRDTDPFYWRTFQFTYSDTRQLLCQNGSESDVSTADEFCESRQAGMTSHSDQSQLDEPCQDTKILFRSQKFNESKLTILSSTKTRPSKLLRFNHTNYVPPEKLDSPAPISVTSETFFRKKLPFSEFQLLCQHLPSKSSTSSLIFNSSLYNQPCDTILIFGGLNSSSKTMSNNDGRHVFQYIPSKNRWTLVSLMPNSRQHHSIVIFQGRIYVAGGTVLSQSKKTTTNSMLSFDPVTVSWFKEKDLPMKVKSFGFVATHLQIYTIGGEDSNDMPTNLVFRYDPVNTTWHEAERMHMKRSNAAVAIHKNHIWVAGGWTTTGITNSVEYFDPITGIWTEAQSALRVPRCFARMCSIKGKLFIVGGLNQERCSVTSIDICDEIWETWKQIDELETPRHGHEVCSINTCMIVIGGINSKTGDVLSNVECYCESKMAWTDDFQSLPMPMVGMVGVVLPSCYVISLRS